MSFRKRNMLIHGSGVLSASRPDQDSLQGTRPSPLDGRLTTSTGTASLDYLLVGHSGMPLGSSLLIEESGTTDFGGVILRYFAGEGLVQGHDVHVLGVGDSWRREIPGLREDRDRANVQVAPDLRKMKIAWRYDSLGSQASTSDKLAVGGASTFCHSFDLTKNLDPRSTRGRLITYPDVEVSNHNVPNVFFNILLRLRAKLHASPSSIHRVIVPSLLSPASYPMEGCKPQDVLQFLHSLRSLLRQFPTRLVILVTLPSSLHPRTAGLCKWIELMFDGVLELVPLSKSIGVADISGLESNKGQGLVRVHAMPVFHERGGGLKGSWNREDMSFKLSASSGISIIPFSLPPVGLEEPAPTPSNPKMHDLNF
ncbi:hypothetical protein E4U57_007836 [Claviceps arundinis]|uniref:Elongator complex protein 4 n=1 Tax=Claviceps arundinis TaxID=1623583 RepID=A0ABQ7P1D3_9HYPO|nr:hypothetical protein E4U57_007836 [Claviceps arundinis]